MGGSSSQSGEWLGESMKSHFSKIGKESMSELILRTRASAQFISVRIRVCIKI